MSSPSASTSHLYPQPVPSWNQPGPSSWHMPSAPPTPEPPSSSSASSAGDGRYLPLQTFSSPSSTPLPPQSRALLDAKRQSLFGRPGAGPRPPHSPSSAIHATGSRSRYDVADTPRRQGNRARPHHRGGGAGASGSFSSPPDRSVAGAGGGAALDQDSPTRQVWRAKFRQRCQQQMARDRARTLASTRGASFLRHLNGDAAEDELVLTPGQARADSVRRPRREDMIGSDDLPSSSDVDIDADMDDSAAGLRGPRWWEEDEELIRRIMVAEYRRIKQAQEASGEREVGWLDPDEVAYLEEETRREREESEMRSAASYAGPQRVVSTPSAPRAAPPDLTPTKNVGPSWAPGMRLPRPTRQPGGNRQETEMEPPEDLLDDDEALYSHYLHHHHQDAAPAAAGAAGMDMQDDDDDDMGATTTATGEERGMSQTWEGDEDFEMALAAMPMLD